MLNAGGPFVGPVPLTGSAPKSTPSDRTVVALLNGGEEVTVKRLHREGEMVKLKPESGEHEALIVSAGEVRIQGRVIWVFHPPGS